MKKVLKYIYGMIIMIICSIVMFGCGVEIESITIKPGTFDTTIVKNSLLLTGDIEAVVKYSNDTTKDITDKDLKFGSIDTSTTGIKYLEVTYENYTFNIKINIVESSADIATVTLFNSSIVNDYNSNIKVQENKQEEFITKTEPYYIGDDNVFNFRINAKGVDGAGNIVENLSNVRTDIKLESVTYNDNEPIYTNLSEDTISAFATINTENSTIDFNDNAIGKEFRITVSAVNYDEDYFDEAPTFNLNVKVVDGYNVYTAQDLSVLDNTGDFGWNDIKSSELQQASNSINGVILHSDIEVKDSDLPSGLFYNETEANAIGSGVTNQEIVGSLKDSADYQIYGRRLNSNQNFSFIGNYYQVDFSNISKVVVQNNNKDGIIVNEDSSKEEAITTHTCFLRFVPKDGNQTFPKVDVKNVSFKGNGKRSSRAIESGGIILLKSNGVEFTADNTIYQDCFIGYMFEKFDDDDRIDSNSDVSKYNILNTKGYNCYNSLLYFWGAKHVIIENSELISAGGPVMIVDHTNNDSATGSGGFPPKVDIINSRLESFVTGEEPWFVTYGATAIMSQIKAADAVYAAVPESIRPTFLVDKDNVEDMINIICVLKSAESEGLTISRVRGSVTIFDSREDYESHVNNGDKSYGLYFEDEINSNNIIDKARGVKSDGTIDANATTNYFQSNKTGGYVSTNGDVNGEFYVGDYANIYLFNGMGAIFGLYPVSE